MANYRNHENFVFRVNSKGEKIVIPKGFARGLSELRKFSKNHVVEGCIVTPNSQAGKINVSTGVVVQDGLVRVVNSTVGSQIPGLQVTGNIIRGIVYVPPLSTNDYTTKYASDGSVTGRRLNSIDVGPEATYSEAGFPALPTGAIPLAKIYYKIPISSGRTHVILSADMIDNSARPRPFEPVGSWQE